MASWPLNESTDRRRGAIARDQCHLHSGEILDASFVSEHAGASKILHFSWAHLALDHLRVWVFKLLLDRALGSVVGEISGYVVGRSGRQAFESTRFSRWIAVQMTHPVRAFVALFALSVPPNPLFDVAGMAAGAFGVPFWIFASAVFCGRFVRMLGIVLVGAFVVTAGT